MFKLKRKWPIPAYRDEPEPHFLFIVTPPFSGSTALAELLNTSHRTMLLQARGEGQWLVPGLCGKDRWSPEKKVNYKSVKAVWIKKYQSINRLVKNIDVVVEKSPPNMMRVAGLSSCFKSHSFIANNRDPYANCASRLFRTPKLNVLCIEKRAELLVEFANDWLVRSQKIKELITCYKMPLVTYERFCENPGTVIDSLGTPAGVAKSINPKAEVRVKDYKMQKVLNQNQRQIAKLKSSDVEILNSIFIGNEALLDFYDYEIVKNH